ncbi:Ca2+/H+ antiporter [Purpureocillium lavendulum]|uniref:Vacuolar calcium ion transporter n=1 Tax=Purpureocillium lavendulum TaxID=1247861 RepID=A0AB34G0Y7_9HYPO|nr:Ca2+/H+ antiporter [Purpureocillium lavendulum]
MAAGHPPPSPSRSRSRRSRLQRDDDFYTPRHISSRDRAATLPAPNTFSEYRTNRPRGDSEKKSRIPSVKPAGESGRRGFHPWHFIRISFRSASKASALCNVLWPVVPAALAVKYALSERHILTFILAYIAMVPCANLIGFAGQEFARKVPHVAGVLVETTCGSVVEIILFMVLLRSDLFYVIKAAILGSILATMLLCLGLCFFVGGLHRDEQTFSDAISEAGSGLLLTAGVVLGVPTFFRISMAVEPAQANLLPDERVLGISRVISVLLIISYCVFVFFQARTHHGIYDAVFEHDEHRDRDKHKDNAKDKLTMTECIIALAISITLATLIAIILIQQIEFIIEDGHVSDAFMGLILVPLVEKFAEHLTAIDEAWDNQTNFALSHVLGATLQTALFNAPLTVIVGWGLNKGMNLDFDLFNLVMLILSILTVGRFLQDQKSNYLEGFLLVILYVAIAVSAFHTPDPPGHGNNAGHSEGNSTEGGH